MIDLVFSNFEDVLRVFRAADVLDILFISVMIYWGLIWFKDTAWRRVLIGITVLLAIYVLARVLNMVLVLTVLHTGFAVLIIILVVIFQEDLRRMFERIANIQWFGWFKPLTPRSVFDVDTLVEAAFTMANSRTGALIVLKGADPLGRHIDGGIPLGAQISRPLLLSIFDASSPGHDGAIVIEKGRIEKFAAHLPISKNHEVIAGRGTRHSAALGLAECSDALAVVVSEERGEVSVAEAGQLANIGSPSLLKQKIESFFEAWHPIDPGDSATRPILRNGWLKLLAIVLAAGAWLMFAYKPHAVERTFVVPIGYHNVSDNRLIDDGAVAEARVTLSGPVSSFRSLQPEALKLSIDLADAPLGYSEIQIKKQHIYLPVGLTLTRVDPPTIKLDLRVRPLAPLEKAPPPGDPKCLGSPGYVNKI